MPQEIERKFLVTGDFRPHAIRAARIVQGYICTVPERTVRIRINDDKGYITIKGSTSANGRSRYEWEKEIPVSEAEELILLCEPGIIDKTRYFIPFGEHLFEVDQFHGENEGLIIAEIELQTEDESFERPAWLGTEVTNDARYYNASLVHLPYSRWK